MSLRDLFKSQEERRKDVARRRRKAFREAEGAIDSVKDRNRKLQTERDRSWTQARVYLQDGNKSAAQRCLQTCRANELLMQKLEMKKWVFEQLLTKLDLAKTDTEFARSLDAINTVVNIDPDAIGDILGEVEDKLGDQMDTDKLWAKSHEKEMDGVEGATTEHVPSVEKMLADLEDEVAIVQEEAVSTSKGGAKAASVSSLDASDLRSRARRIIDGEAT